VFRKITITLFALRLLLSANFFAVADDRIRDDLPGITGKADFVEDPTYSADGIVKYLPRGFTAEELLRKHEIGSYVKGSTPPPAGIRAVGEYEPSNGVMVSYASGFQVPDSLLRSFARQTKLWIICASSSKTTVQNYLTSIGINMASVWIRDYGPWWIMQSDGRQGIWDVAYNRPRPQDDAIPVTIGTQWSIPSYTTTLISTGGDYMSNGTGQAMSTRLVYDENGGDSAWVDAQMLSYGGVNDYVVMTDPQASYIDHIDCWAKILAPDRIIVLQVPASHGDYANIEQAAAYLSNQINHYGKKWKIYRVYSSGTEGYTNSLILNNYVYVPVWGTANDAAALTAYRNALPGFTVIGIPYSGWINTDALHCRSMGVVDSLMLWVDHIPVADTQAINPVTINSFIRCHPKNTLTTAILYYRTGTTGSFTSVPMTPTKANTHTAQIPGFSNGTTVQYYISAADNSGRTGQQPLFAPNTWFHSYVISSLLGVEMSQYSALAKDDGVEIVWQTACDVNCLRWGIERSENANGGYKEIASLPVSGNSGTCRSYFYTDKSDLPEGTYYYRLAEIGTNGEKVYYGPMMVALGRSLPDCSVLSNSKPNPFNQMTNIKYQISKSGPVRLKVYNLAGQVVKTLVSDHRQAGFHTAIWDGRDDRGQAVPSGVYFYKLVSGEFSGTKRIMVIK
jgi:agmatine deiminase